MKIYPTWLGTYQFCPYAFFLKHVKKVKPIPSPWQEQFEHGSLVHKIIEEYYKAGTDGDIRQRIMAVMEQHDIDERVEQNIGNFIKFEEWRQKKGFYFVASEKHYCKGELCGIVDAVFRDGERVVVVDFKTSRGHFLNSNYNIQGSVYKYITGADRVYFVFLEGKLDIIEQTEFNYEKIDLYISQIEQKNFIKNTENCAICDMQIACKYSKYKEVV